MPSSYPGALDAFTNPSAGGGDTLDDPPHDGQHADANDAIEAIETELGINPRGSEATVRARLDAIESATSDLVPRSQLDMQAADNPANASLPTAETTFLTLNFADPGGPVKVMAHAWSKAQSTSGTGNLFFVRVTIDGTASGDTATQEFDQTFSTQSVGMSFGREFTPVGAFTVTMQLWASDGNVQGQGAGVTAMMIPA